MAGEFPADGPQHAAERAIPVPGGWFIEGRLPGAPCPPCVASNCTRLLYPPLVRGHMCGLCAAIDELRRECLVLEAQTPAADAIQGIVRQLSQLAQDVKFEMFIDPMLHTSSPSSSA